MSPESDSPQPQEGQNYPPNCRYVFDFTFSRDPHLEHSLTTDKLQELRAQALMHFGMLVLVNANDPAQEAEDARTVFSFALHASANDTNIVNKHEPAAQLLFDWL